MPSCDGSNCGACSSNEKSSEDSKTVNRLMKELKSLKINLAGYMEENKQLRDLIIADKLKASKPAPRKAIKSKRKTK